MKIMGIDGASKKTGIALIHMNILSYEHLINLSSTADSSVRQDKMTLAIIGEIISQKPDVVYYEDNYTGRNPKTAKMLAQILGGVRAYCAFNSIEFHAIMPSSWRKILEFKSKNRTDAKQEAISYVNQKYGVKCGDDVADAICIATAGNMIKGENDNEG